MNYTLIPICSQVDHEIITNDEIDLPENRCYICNKDRPEYHCSNCDYYRCLKCHNNINNENLKIIQSMKNTLTKAFNDIQKTCDSEILYCKKSGDIYINSDSTLTKYPHEEK
tara:strand:+ start:448 stop:783 length:336 start_codon:yes stop_codon:yes gene_type:complete